MDITLSEAINRFNRYLKASGKSAHTIADYNNGLNKLVAFVGEDHPLADLTIEDLEEFFADLYSRKRAPRGCAPRPARVLSDKTIQNIHTGLSSMWSWAVKRGFVDTHVARRVEVRKPQKPVIEIFTQEQVQKMLDACKVSAPWAKNPHIVTERDPGLVVRDQAIIIFLLDTGVRASELCALTIGDVDLDARMVSIRKDAKNKKPRDVKFGRRATRALLAYLDIRPFDDFDLPLFSAVDRSNQIIDEHIDRRVLSRNIKRLGERAKVGRAYPHRFRHTFATTYLRNGGDMGTLQELLGHSSLDMVLRYVHFVKADLAAAHRRASPADKWKLKV